MQSDTEKLEKIISETLDRLHEYAAQANLEKYLALFSECAVFMGTDKEERWPMALFRPYVAKRFEGGTGWAYRAIARNISVAPDGKAAWFDERLQHETGEARGSGVLVLEGEAWKIAQYNLCFPIPNALLRPFRDIIRVVG